MKRVNKTLLIVLIVLVVCVLGTNILLKIISKELKPSWYTAMLIDKYHDLDGTADTPSLMYPDPITPPIQDEAPKSEQPAVQTTTSEQPQSTDESEQPQRDPTANQIGNKLYKSDAWDPGLEALYYAATDVPERFQALQNYVSGADPEKIFNYYSGDIQVDTQYGDAIIYITTGDGKYTVIRLDDNGYTEFTNSAPVVALN